MSEYITVAKNDKSFKSYMLGKVPENESVVSIPVKAFNNSKYKDKITFQLINKENLESPTITQLSTQLVRLRWLTLTLTPVVCSMAYLVNISFTFNILNLLLIGFTILFSHSSIFILNDFYDHLFGVDAISSKGGSRVIQNAWLLASEVRIFGFVCLSLAIALGGYLSFQFGQKIILLGALGLLIGWLYSYFTKFKRFMGLNTLIINIFMGPFLVLGFSWGTVNYYNATLVAMGILFGLLAYLCIGFRHIENLYLSNKRIGASVVEYLGFDRAKQFLLSIFILLPFIYSYLIISFSIEINILNIILFSGPLIIYLPVLFSILRLNSSMGSSIVKLRNMMAYLHLYTGLSLTLYLLFN